MQPVKARQGNNLSRGSVMVLLSGVPLTKRISKNLLIRRLRKWSEIFMTLPEDTENFMASFEFPNEREVDRGDALEEKPLKSLVIMQPDPVAVRVGLLVRAFQRAI
jgi:hypothetical protein